MHVCSLVISFVQFFMTWGCAEGLAIVSPTWLVTIVLSTITDYHDAYNTQVNE